MFPINAFDSVEKNCNNCRYKNRTREQHIIARCHKCRESDRYSYGWQPDYETLDDELECVEAELQQYKEALRLACEDLETVKGCPESKYECHEGNGDSPCIDCFIDYFLTKAKGG